MRPQRKAAIAAKAAIESVSKQLEDTPEEAITLAKAVQDDETAFEPGQPTQLDFKRQKVGARSFSSTAKKQKVQHEKEVDSVQFDDSVVVIENPSLLDKLPAELRKEILSYFDTDPLTICSLMQVSKHWYSLLTLGERADADWKRRCLKMGSKHKSPKCKTWQETYMKIIKKKCAVCFKNTTAKLGLLLEKGPSWIVVCEPCQFESGPYRVVTEQRAIQHYGVPEHILRRLKSKWRKVDDEYWVRDYLASTVVRLSGKLKRIEAEKKRLEETKRQEEEGKKGQDESGDGENSEKGEKEAASMTAEGDMKEQEKVTTSEQQEEE